MSELGYYTSILSVSLPSSANPGESVRIAVQIQNITPNSVYVACMVSGLLEPLNLGEATLRAWEFRTFEGYFTMPPQASYPAGVVDLIVRSMVWTGNWWNDAQFYTGIRFGAPPGPSDWQPLGEISTAISAGIDLTGYSLIKQVTFPDGKTYSGPAQEVTAYFEAPEISWVEDQVVAAFVRAAGDRGAGMLSFKLYQKPGFIIGHYILVLTGYQKAAAYKGAAAFVITVAWSVVILAALVVLGIVAATFFVAKVVDLVWGPPGKESKGVSAGVVIVGIALVAGIFVLPQLTKKST